MGPLSRLLVSVRSADEARAALAGGANLIDVKDPAKGSLGAPENRDVEQVVGEVGGKAPVSVALGELRNWGRLANLAIPAGVDYAKLGMAGCASWPDWPERWAAAIASLPSSVRSVAVVYADITEAQSPEPDCLIAEAARLGCAAVLVDTFDKSRGSLLEAWSSERLAAFVRAVRKEGMLAVVGGSLTLETIPQAALLRPDYVAIRGAACRGGRNGPVEAKRVREAADRIAAANPRGFIPDLLDNC